MKGNDNKENSVDVPEKSDNSVKAHEYMASHIHFCKLIAMWPVASTENRYERIRHATVVALATSQLITFVVTLFSKIISEFPNVAGIAPTIDYATLGVSGLVRYVYIYFYGSVVAELIKFMNDNFVHESFHQSEGKINMDKYTRIGKYVGLLYCSTGILYALQVFVTPIFKYLAFAPGTGPKPLISLALEAMYPFDTSTHPLRELVFVQQGLSLFTLGYIYLVSDAFWWMLLAVAIGQYAIITHSVENIPILLENEDDGMVDALKKCIEQHQITRQFLKKVENLLSPIILVDFIHAVVSITFIMLDFTIALNEGDRSKVFHLLQYFSLSIFHMFVFDWLGSEIIAREEELCRAIYDTSWYQQPKPFRRQVLTTLLNLRRPRKLTGGKMFSVTLEFFAGTIRMIFSYFMFLYQLRSEA